MSERMWKIIAPKGHNVSRARRPDQSPPPPPPPKKKKKKILLELGYTELYSLWHYMLLLRADKSSSAFLVSTHLDLSCLDWDVWPALRPSRKSKVVDPDSIKPNRCLFYPGCLEPAVTSYVFFVFRRVDGVTTLARNSGSP